MKSFYENNVLWIHCAEQEVKILEAHIDKGTLVATLLHK